MACKCNSNWDRRTFLRFALGSSAAVAMNPALSLFAQDTVAKTRTKSAILLWMSGGPSQLDTWDPKYGQKTGGEFKPLNTSVRGMQISEHLPTIASQGKHFSIIRSLTTKEAAHERGTALMHTGYSPIVGQPFAPVGTVASYELSRKDYPLPTYIALSPPDIPQCTLFGDAHLPFGIRDVRNPIPNIKSMTYGSRAERRAELLRQQETNFTEGREGRAMEGRAESAKKAQDLMTTPLLRAFDVNKESAATRKAYGGDFGQKCLLARRLVEVGVPFVEVGLGGWDTHDNNFDRVKRNSAALDRGMGNLIKDLAERDMLKDTLVIWAGEFGRTPVINSDNGRDHWTRCFSTVLAGGGTEGGRVIGATDKTGMDIKQRPVMVQDFFATIYKCLGIDWNKRYMVNNRKVKYSYNGKPIKELF